MRVYHLVFLLLLILAPAIHAQSEKIVFTDCPFNIPAEQEIECGFLVVPENRQADTGNELQLAFAIFYSFSDSPFADPIIYLEGGPGGSALTAPDLWFDSSFRDERDVILIDQRGTGFSLPSLNCPELDESEDTIEGALECQDRLLDEDIDLSAFNSRENAADIDDLRIALGYDEVNLYGVSYGTRLGLTVLRDHPEGLRSVVLDSVYPPNIDTNYNVAIDTYNLMSLMFADCAADSVCSSAFPDLENRFYEALDTLDMEPALVEDPETGEEIELYSANVLNMLYSQLQTTMLISAIPASLDALANDDYETWYILATEGADDSEMMIADSSGEIDPDEAFAIVDEILAELFEEEIPIIEDMAIAGDTQGVVDFLMDSFEMDEDEAQFIAEAFVLVYSEDMGGFEDSDDMEVINEDADGDSEGMFYSVQCHEELPFMDLDTAFDIALDAGVPEIIAEGIIPYDEFEICSAWSAGEVDPLENEAVVSDVPVLLLAARYDTATPPDWAFLAAETLSNSFVVEFPGVGHAVIDGGECPQGVSLEFLASPDQEPDTSCIASMGIDYFVP